MAQKPLRLTINGRIIDHLGIQMYQSPVAAIAELISNAWDADATRVDVTLPDTIAEGSEIVIKDDGIGMTYEECQDRYLNVGAGRRDNYPDRTPGGRLVLGRKGIGKFAGFGISLVMNIDTTSRATGEKTSFSLDVNKIRTEIYAGEGIDVDEAQFTAGAGEVPATEAGTTITLTQLKLQRAIAIERFVASMARRFLLHQTAADFKIYINGTEVPSEPEDGEVEYSFPSAYSAEELPGGLVIDENGWGTETLSNDRQIKWRFNFFKETVDDEELRGISIFARGKLVQKPFFFNLSGGLGGQHGQQYMSGQVIADYIDDLGEDLIAPERQRVNWENTETSLLEKWGQDRVKELLILWKKKRGERRQQQIEDRLAGFSERIEGLQRHEAKTVRKALRSLGGIETLSDEQFQELGSAVLTAWEQGRLHELIADMSEADTLDPAEVLNLLTEVKVLDALNVAEAVKVKSSTIEGLRTRIASRELENNLRDYVAANPWLLSAKWETFRVETAVDTILREAAVEVGLNGTDYQGRIDLALRSGNTLLVVEFMRPGLTLDFDHASRCERYILRIRAATAATTALGITEVHGLIVADNLDRRGEMPEKLRALDQQKILAHSWATLLDGAASEWKELIDILVSRSPGDVRLRGLGETTVPEEQGVQE